MMSYKQLSVGQLASSIALGTEMSQLQKFSLVKIPRVQVAAGVSFSSLSRSRLLYLLNTSVYKIWLAGEAICDILIAICMTYIVRTYLFIYATDI